jgi:hypothetical protein
MQPSRWVERRGGPAAGTGIAFASRLPLRRYRDIPGFLRDTRTVRAQLREAPGLAGYSLRAQFLRKTFWTLSLWESAPDLALFAAGDRHRGIAAGLANRIKAPLFVRWPHEFKDGPPTWSAARARLADTGKMAHPNPERQKGYRHSSPERR